MNEYHNWAADKRVSIGHIVTTLALIGSMIMGLANLYGRLAVTENNVNHNAKAIRDIRADQAAQYAEIIRRLERLDSKMDPR